jgi:hypothetical protein
MVSIYSNQRMIEDLSDHINDDLRREIMCSPTLDNCTYKKTVFKSEKLKKLTRKKKSLPKLRRTQKMDIDYEYNYNPEPVFYDINENIHPSEFIAFLLWKNKYFATITILQHQEPNQMTFCGTITCSVFLGTKFIEIAKLYNSLNYNFDVYFDIMHKGKHFNFDNITYYVYINRKQNQHLYLRK